MKYWFGFMMVFIFVSAAYNFTINMPEYGTDEEDNIMAQKFVVTDPARRGNYVGANFIRTYIPRGAKNVKSIDWNWCYFELDGVKYIIGAKYGRGFLAALPNEVK